MPILRIIDSPFTWGTLGFIIGASLGVNATSVWLVAIGFGGFLMYLRIHGPADHHNEGWLFAGGPSFMMSWVLGFVVRGILT